MLSAGLLAAVVVGHLALMATTVSRTHSFGLNIDLLNRLTYLLGAAVAVTTPWACWRLAGLPLGDWPWGLRLYAYPCLAVALVVLPIVTALRLARGAPAGLRGGERGLVLADDAGRPPRPGSGLYGAMLRLPGNESLRLMEARWSVPRPWMAGTDGPLTILQVTDLHFSPAYDRGYFEAVATAAAATEADLVVFTGDLVDDDATIDWIEPVLSRLRGRCGTFAILGNHDRSHQPRRLEQELGRAGFTILEGRWATVDCRGKTLAVGGTSTPWGPPLDLGGRPDADASLLLSHSPDQFAWAERAGFDLVLSGHNHGGQVRLPGFGPLLMPSRHGRRYDQGFFERGRTLMYVSRGVGAKQPIRYGCPPEITRLAFDACPVGGRRRGSVSARMNS